MPPDEIFDGVEREASAAAHVQAELDELVGIAAGGPAATPRRRMAPAEGERNAMVGYLGQYQLAAARTLEGLRTGILERVRLADVQAGQIDDFQLVFPEVVEAHQVKWSREAGTIGFFAFSRDTKQHPAYIRQLADGWKRLTAFHAPRRVTVHFVSNDRPSTHSQVPKPPDAGDSSASWHFAAFLSQAWQPAGEAARRGEDQTSAFDPRWEPAFRTLRQASGLTGAEWPLFIRDCVLELGTVAPGATIAAAPLSQGERHAWRRDVDTLTLLFQQLVAASDQKVDFSRDDLLRSLRWHLRTEFLNRHEFPEPQIPYRGIAATVRELNERIGRFTGGYIALLGSPGSGKSTLLSKTILPAPYRLIRYYAYVPDSIGSRRGESSRFLHDIVLELQRAGMRVGGTMLSDDPQLLAERFERQLEMLHREWVETGKRTIIVVDGLDHIEREQDPERSLLRDLPPPERVPDGVLFLLGSQTDHLNGLSARIRDALSEDGRRITIHHLEREDVRVIVEEAGLPVPPSLDEHERIFGLSAGHPLALNYIINKLRLSAGRPVATVLDEVEPFHERIDVQYATIWARVESEFELARLLALLARHRGMFRIEWIAQWAPGAALHRVTTELAHYFRQETGQRWTFFHNSFRAFIVEKTRDLPALRGDAAMYRALANQCAESHAADPERADELYYRARAGEDERALALGQTAMLREQLLAGRPLTLIQADLETLIGVAFRHRDVVRLTSALLARAEFGQRSYYADLLPIAEVQIELGDVELALPNIREGTALRVPRWSALRAAAALEKAGRVEEARTVFMLAEPLDHLRGTAKALPKKDEEDEVKIWAEAAPRFHSLQEILGMINRIHVEVDALHRQPHGAGDEDDDQESANRMASESRRYSLLRHVAGSLDEMGRLDDADEIREHLRAYGPGASAWWFWSMVDGWYHALVDGLTDRAESRFNVVITAIERGDLQRHSLEDQALITLADGYLRIRHDPVAAHDWLSGVEQPVPVTGLSSSISDGEFRPYMHRFRLNRVLGALGDVRPASEIVPEAVRQEDVPYVAFERAVVDLAHLAGAASMTPLSPEAFLERARPLIRLFAAPEMTRRAYSTRAARGKFYETLIITARRCGPECVDALRLALDAEWSKSDQESEWPDTLIRDLVLECLAAGAPREWTAGWLQRLEPLTFAGDSLESDLPEALKHARAWLMVGDVGAARRTLTRIVGATFGNEARDGQLASCVSWAIRANRVDPARAPDRIGQIAVAVASLQGAEAAGYVAPALLEAAHKAGAPLAAALVEWGFQHEVCGWRDGLTSLLGGIVEESPGALAVASTIYRTLMLPFETGAQVDLVARIAEELRRAGDPELDRLSEAIEVVAIGSARPALRVALSGEKEEARELLRNPDLTDPSSPAHVVEAFEGLELTLRELQQRVRTLDDVRDLVGRLRPNAYMHRWELILRPIIAAAAADHLVAIAEVLPTNDSTWKALAAIAERLIVLGERRSQAVAERVISASSAPGWHDLWDGGSRIRGFELLSRVAPAAARDQAWDMLAHDVVGEKVGLRELFSSWDRIVPILIEGVPDLPIWDCMSAHASALTAYAPRPDPPLLPMATDPRDASLAAETLTRFAVTYLDHPARALAQGAQRFLTDRLLSGDEAVRGALFGRLVDEEVPKDGALLVLQAVSLVDPDAVRFAREALEPLRRTDDFRDRRAVQVLLALLGEQGEEHSPPRVQRPLPPVFAITHPRAYWPEEVAPGRGRLLPPATNVPELIRVFRPHLDAIAQLAGVQPEALYHYVAELAGATLESPNPPDEEPQIRRELSGIGLEITYRRPRPRRVEGAMLRALSMLVDRGWIAPEALPVVDRIIRNADPWFLIHRPTARPSAICPIVERSGSKYVAETWVQGVSITCAAVGVTHDGTDGVILAEDTWLRWLDWKMATEVRLGVRVPTGDWVLVDASEENVEAVDKDEDLEGESSLDDHVTVLAHSLSSDYSTREGDSDHLIIRNIGYRFETPGHSWLALNPTVGRELGWRLSPEGLFRWVNASGEVMVESIWWEDGFSGHRPPHFDDEVGHGWCVRASELGWREISEHIGNASDWRRVERAAYKMGVAARECWHSLHAASI